MPTAETARRLRIEGVVQGVGFRPFVARTADSVGVDGWVTNTGEGVRVHVEGDRAAVEAAAERIESDPPPLATVDRVARSRAEPEGYDGFTIRDSATGGDGTALVPPDTGICRQCLADLRDPESPYHSYWATACVDCGPRFSVTRRLPYDRERTSMADFPLCADCRSRYETSTDRRYHAQTVACPDCGPTVRAVTDDGESLTSGRAATERAAEWLRDGDVVGIKGTGGSHIAVDATDTDALERLRERLDRPAKPFAVMAPSLENVTEWGAPGPTERGWLRDTRRPIVAVDDDDRPWQRSVAPGLGTVGVMLPYAGLHHLLFEAFGDGPLVVTSANRPGEPMATTTEGLLGVGAIDGALVHDREIVARCDDSVLRVDDGRTTLLRRSRGWVPRPLDRPDSGGPTVLAVGGEFDTTVAVSRDRDVVLSQHIGDVDGPDGARAHRETVEHLLTLLQADPDVVAHDEHPEYVTTTEARERPERAVGVQHHHAHAAALLAERGVDRAVVATLDGTGYGPDGTVWGGEVLVADRQSFERVGGLAPFGLPGGTAAVEFPARTLATLLDDAAAVDSLLADRGVQAGETSEGDAARVRRQADRGVNCPTTTSAGRYLDAVAALLGVCTRRRYQGQPAMELEAVAARGEPLGWSVPERTVDGRRCVDTTAVVRRIAEAQGSASTADLAATAQSVLARGLAALAEETAADRGLPVGLSGGVAANGAIRRTLQASLGDRSLLTHRDVPPGDGGLAYGQAVVALAGRGD